MPIRAEHNPPSAPTPAAVPAARAALHIVTFLPLGDPPLLKLPISIEDQFSPIRQVPKQKSRFPYVFKLINGQKQERTNCAAAQEALRSDSNPE